MDFQPTKNFAGSKKSPDNMANRNWLLALFIGLCSLCSLGLCLVDHTNEACEASGCNVTYNVWGSALSKNITCHRRKWTDFTMPECALKENVADNPVIALWVFLLKICCEIPLPLASTRYFCSKSNLKVSTTKCAHGKGFKKSFAQTASLP